MIGSENAPMPVLNGITPELRTQLLNALIQFPTIEQMQEIWFTYFEPCLQASDNLEVSKYEKFTENNLTYMLEVLQQLK